MITSRTVNERRLVGTLFFNATGDPRPAIIVLPGSEGGIPEFIARKLAFDGGFTTLALAYFGRRTLPRRLVEVPLELVGDAARWLGKQPQTRPGPVGLMGGSKGAELALLVASHLPEAFGPTVAYAPSCVAWAGVEFFAPDSRLLAGIFGTASVRSSWTLDGTPLPFVHHAPGVLPRITRRGISVARSFEVALADTSATPHAAIPVENLPGRLLLISGGRDAMWPAAPMARAITERLHSLGLDHKVEHLDLPEAGHRLEPEAPPRGIQRLSAVLDYGGSEQANRSARQQAWERTVNFLDNELPEGRNDSAV